MTAALIPRPILQRAMQSLVDEGRAEFVQTRGRPAIRLTALGLALKGGAQHRRKVR
jgi:hypothetical protein